MNPFNFALARRHRGFTLIELLIVISILVILSVAVAMNFIGFDYDARHSSTKSNIASLRSAISLYRSRHSKFPEPKASGGRKATQGGEHTLEAILTNTGTFGDNTEYIRGNIAGELISSSKENGRRQRRWEQLGQHRNRSLIPAAPPCAATSCVP